LNFFLLRDFIKTHDTGYPPRFRTFKSMATSFYMTDLFIRDVTDSGATPPAASRTEDPLSARADPAAAPEDHDPEWMQTYFGFSLLEKWRSNARR